MSYNNQTQNWQLNSGSGRKQSQPSGIVHTITIIVWMLISLSICVLGFVLIFDKNTTIEDLGLSLTFLIAAVGVIYIFAVATRTTKVPIKTFILGVLLVLAGLLLHLCKVNFIASTYRLGTGIIGIIIALFMFVDVWRERMDGAPWIASFVWGLVYLIISIVILFLQDGTRLLSIITGIYLILLAGNFFFEALSSLFYAKPHLRRNVVISLPMGIAAFLPMALFREINTMVKEEPDKVLFLENPDAGTEPDLIVYIHTRAGFIPGFGHCDLCYDGLVYSYGDYDEATWKLQGFVADGVLAQISPEKHIEMALDVDKKILMAYGIKLTDELKKGVEGELDKIMSQAYPWEPKAQLAAEGKIKGDPKSFKDVGSTMYLDEDAKLYKFEKGSSYKTYYALGENCSEVVNDVVGKTGIDLFKLNGIITPGTYLEYLDELYTTDNTIVVDRRLYMLNEDGKPVEYPLNPKQPIRLGDMSN